MKKKSFTPINPGKYSCYGLKKIHTRNLKTKNIAATQKFPAPHNFSNCAHFKNVHIAFQLVLQHWCKISCTFLLPALWRLYQDKQTTKAKKVYWTIRLRKTKTWEKKIKTNNKKKVDYFNINKVLQRGVEIVICMFFFFLRRTLYFLFTRKGKITKIVEN